MHIDDLLDENLIDLNVKDGNKFQVIEDLLDVAIRAGKVIERKSALKDLIEREQYLSTGFENGLAVPHAKTEAVREMVLVFGVSREGIEFDSLDGKPTHYIFLLLSPMDTSGPHIQILALIARNFQNSDILQKLHDASTAKKLLQLLKEFK